MFLARKALMMKKKETVYFSKLHYEYSVQTSSSGTTVYKNDININSNISQSSAHISQGYGWSSNGLITLYPSEDFPIEDVYHWTGSQWVGKYKVQVLVFAPNSGEAEEVGQLRTTENLTYDKIRYYNHGTVTWGVSNAWVCSLANGNYGAGSRFNYWVRFVLFDTSLGDDESQPIPKEHRLAEITHHPWG